MNKEYNLLDIVEKMTGNIESIGSTHIDEKRNENLKDYCNFLEYAVYKLIENVKHQEGLKYMYSCKENYTIGLECLKTISKDINDLLEEVQEND